MYVENAFTPSRSGSRVAPTLPAPAGWPHELKKGRGVPESRVLQIRGGKNVAAGKAV